MRSWLEVITIAQGKKSINPLNWNIRISNVNLLKQNIPNIPNIKQRRKSSIPRHPDPLIRAFSSPPLPPPRFENPRKLCHFSIFPIFPKITPPTYSTCALLSVYSWPRRPPSAPSPASARLSLSSRRYSSTGAFYASTASSNPRCASWAILM